MYLPTFAVIAMMGAGALDFMGAMGLEHLLMLPTILARREEYSCDHRHHQQGHAPTTA